MKPKNVPPQDSDNVIDPDTVMKRVLNTAGLEKQPKPNKKKRARTAAKNAGVIKTARRVDPDPVRRKERSAARSNKQPTPVQDRRSEARKTTGRPQAPRNNRG